MAEAASPPASWDWRCGPSGRTHCCLTAKWWRCGATTCQAGLWVSILKRREGCVDRGGGDSTRAAPPSPTLLLRPPFPPHAGARVHLLATAGPPGVATLVADTIDPGTPLCVVAGWVVFGRAARYESAAAFAADTHRHAVPPGSPYAWTPHTPCYGWPVVEVGGVDGAPSPPTARGTRVVRSLFAFDGDPVA